ncbi:MAG: hypothetical protein KJ550_13270, partial [Proteobacteria bacterium]|nr:hypothetical protein [Pseudomonadota bacterium]
VTGSNPVPPTIKIKGLGQVPCPFLFFAADFQEKLVLPDYSVVQCHYISACFIAFFFSLWPWSPTIQVLPVVPSMRILFPLQKM